MQVIQLTQNPFPLSTLVDNLWFAPLQFNLLSGRPLSSDTSCKISVHRIWCSAACAQCLKNGRKRPGDYPDGASGFSAHGGTGLYHPEVDESPCSVTHIPEPAIKPSNSQVVVTTNVLLGLLPHTSLAFPKPSTDACLFPGFHTTMSPIILSTKLQFPRDQEGLCQETRQ